MISLDAVSVWSIFHPIASNLNVIERFWHFMTRHVLFNEAHANFGLFKQAFDGVFGNLHEHAAALESLITDRFRLIGRSEAGISSALRYTHVGDQAWAA